MSWSILAQAIQLVPAFVSMALAAVDWRGWQRKALEFFRAHPTVAAGGLTRSERLVVAGAKEAYAVVLYKAAAGVRDLGGQPCTLRRVDRVLLWGVCRHPHSGLHAVWPGSAPVWHLPGCWPPLRRCRTPRPRRSHGSHRLQQRARGVRAPHRALADPYRGHPHQPWRHLQHRGAHGLHPARGETWARPSTPLWLECWATSVMVWGMPFWGLASRRQVISTTSGPLPTSATRNWNLSLEPRLKPKKRWGLQWPGQTPGEPASRRRQPWVWKLPRRGSRVWVAHLGMSHWWHQLQSWKRDRHRTRSGSWPPLVSMLLSKPPWLLMWPPWMFMPKKMQPSKRSSISSLSWWLSMWWT